MEAAIKLFHINVLPIATRGLQLIWEHLNTSCLRKLEKVKAIYLKKASGLSKHALSGTVYELTKEPFLIEELRLKLDLPSTRSYDLTVNELQRKKAAIWHDFYSTEAMTTEDWKQTNYELWHLVTRMAVHGFHHKICTNKIFP